MASAAVSTYSEIHLTAFFTVKAKTRGKKVWIYFQKHCLLFQTQVLSWVFYFMKPFQI